MGPRIAVECTVSNVAGDADNLPLRLIFELAHDPSADYEPILQRIGVFPILLGHRLVNHHDRSRFIVVAVGEGSPVFNRDLVDLEEAGRDCAPGAAAMEGTLLRGTAYDEERQPVAALQWHATR